MDKDAFYFPHFCNARHDRKIKRMRKELGLESYGIFFMLLEVLREQIDMKYPMSDIDLLSDEFGTSEQKIRTVIANYQLFELDDDEKFFSPKLQIYMQPYLKSKEQRRNAINSRWNKQKQLNENNTTEIRPYNDRITTEIQSKVKESKVNKENEIKENDFDSDQCIQKLWIKTFGKNPLIPEYEKTKELVETYGYDKVANIMKKVVLKGWKSLDSVEKVLTGEYSLEKTEKTEPVKAEKIEYSKVILKNEVIEFYDLKGKLTTIGKPNYEAENVKEGIEKFKGVIIDERKN